MRRNIEMTEPKPSTVPHPPRPWNNLDFPQRFHKLIQEQDPQKMLRVTSRFLNRT